MNKARSGHDNQHGETSGGNILSMASLRSVAMLLLSEPESYVNIRFMFCVVTGHHTFYALQADLAAASTLCRGHNGRQGVGGSSDHPAGLQAGTEVQSMGLVRVVVQTLSRLI